MCGIFGVVGNHNSNTSSLKGVLEQLFTLSESRGREASGFAYTDGRKLLIYRTPRTAHDLIKETVFADAVESVAKQADGFALIGHSRLATNGSPYSDINNQPVMGKETVFIHNGIVVNASSFWQKYFPDKKAPELDTKIIAELFEHIAKKDNVMESLKTLFKIIQGETSIAMLKNSQSSLFLATNTGSIYYGTTSEGIFVFSSERYITETVLHNKTKTIHLKAGEITEVPFFSLRAHPHGKEKIPRLPSSSQITRRTIEQIKDTYVFTHTQNSFLNSLKQLKTHEPNYNAIRRIPRCTRCILPVTMPLITFDDDGVCNFCKTYTSQKPEGKNKLESFIKPFRSKNEEADCIVPLSGGRDSSYGLHYAKKILHLNPIAYTYDWGMVTDIARRNQSRMCAALGIEHIWVSADITKKRENIKKNIEAWLKKPDLGMVTLLMAGDKQAEYYAEDVKRKTGIDLTIYCRGNQLEDERFKFGYYGIFDGTPKGVIHDLSQVGKLKMLSYYGKQFITNPAYLNSSLIDTMWGFASAYLMHHDFTYLWHYIPWNEQEIVSTLKTQYGWETPTDTIATWRIDDGTPPFYNYIYYQIQGFTEHDGLRSNQIREGVITRSEALKLIDQENLPRYEALKWYFDILNLDGDKVLSAIDSLPRLYKT